MVRDLESDVPSCKGHVERILVFLAVGMDEAKLDGIGFVGKSVVEDEMFVKSKVMRVFVRSMAQYYVTPETWLGSLGEARYGLRYFNCLNQMTPIAYHETACHLGTAQLSLNSMVKKPSERLSHCLNSDVGHPHT